MRTSSIQSAYEFDPKCVRVRPKVGADSIQSACEPPSEMALSAQNERVKSSLADHAICVFPSHRFLAASYQGSEKMRFSGSLLPNSKTTRHGRSQYPSLQARHSCSNLRQRQRCGFRRRWPDRIRSGDIPVPTLPLPHLFRTSSSRCPLPTSPSKRKSAIQEARLYDDRGGTN